MTDRNAERELFARHAHAVVGVELVEEVDEAQVVPQDEVLQLDGGVDDRLRLLWRPLVPVAQRQAGQALLDSSKHAPELAAQRGALQARQCVIPLVSTSCSNLCRILHSNIVLYQRRLSVNVGDCSFYDHVALIIIIKSSSPDD